MARLKEKVKKTNRMQFEAVEKAIFLRSRNHVWQLPGNSRQLFLYFENTFDTIEKIILPAYELAMRQCEQEEHSQSAISLF